MKKINGTMAMLIIMLAMAQISDWGKAWKIIVSSTAVILLTEIIAYIRKRRK